jgi:hypothetical protein
LQSLFRNAELARELDEQGACRAPLLLTDELAALRALYDGAHPGGQLADVVRDVHMTIMSPDKDYKAAIRDGLMAILGPACERLFREHRLLAPFFIVKPSGAGSSIALHQDPPPVDETSHWAVKLWIPLEDVTREHGALWYLPRSHRFPNPVRGLGVLWPDLRSVAEKAVPWMRVCEMKAGEAIVFYHRLFHGSPPNLSQRQRVAVSVGIMPAQLPVRLYVQESEASALEIYEAPDNHIYESVHGVRDNKTLLPSRGKRIAQLPPSRPRAVTWDELLPLLGPAAAAGG